MKLIFNLLSIPKEKVALPNAYLNTLVKSAYALCKLSLGYLFVCYVGNTFSYLEIKGGRKDGSLL